MKTVYLSNKKVWLSIIFSAGMVATVPFAAAQSTGTEGMSGTMEQGEAIKKAPTFQEADKNGDHYITKDELQDYPDLLKHFDSVDAGSTGKLEEHEYANLVMEKRRERGR